MDFSTARFIGSWPSFKQLPKKFLPEVAFVGRSNVGKSSLLNALSKQPKLARVSQTPGKTQEFVFFEVQKRAFLVDLPGYGYARVSKDLQQRWQEIEIYLLERVDALVLLIDIRHGLTAVDKQFLSWLSHHNVRHLIVLTKADKLSSQKRVKATADISKELGSETMSVSIEDKISIEKLRMKLQALMLNKSL